MTRLYDLLVSVDLKPGFRDILSRQKKDVVWSIYIFEHNYVFSFRLKQRETTILKLWVVCKNTMSPLCNSGVIWTSWSYRWNTLSQNIKQWPFSWSWSNKTNVITGSITEAGNLCFPQCPDEAILKWPREENYRIKNGKNKKICTLTTFYWNTKIYKW
jgi:hypothetical protein